MPKGKDFFAKFDPQFTFSEVSRLNWFFEKQNWHKSPSRKERKRQFFFDGGVSPFCHHQRHF